MMVGRFCQIHSVMLIISNGLGRYTFRGCPSTGVTAHIRKDRGYKYIGSLLEQLGWTYVDIETGEPIADFK